MQIIRDKNTNEIIYAEMNLSLTEDGVSGNNFIASNIKPSDHELISVDKIPTDFKGRHYTYINDEWKRTPTGLEYAITKKKAAIKEIFLSKMQKPIIDTGLGFSVDGGRDNLQDFQGGLALGYYLARDSENLTHQLTKEEMEQIIAKIQANGLALYQRKWELEGLVDIDVETDITTGWPV